MRFNTAFKKIVILLLAGKWMELEIIVLSEISQTQRQLYHESRRETAWEWRREPMREEGWERRG